MKTLHRILCSILSLSIFAAATHKVEAANVPGSVIAWGAGATATNVDPEFGQSLVPSNLVGGATSVSGGLYHSVALKNDGTVMAWGYNGYGQTSIPIGVSTVAAVATLPYTTVSGVVATFQPNPAAPGNVNTCTIAVSPTVNSSLIMAAIVPGMTVTGPANSVGAAAVITSKVTSGSVTTLTFSVVNAVTDATVVDPFNVNLTITAPPAWGSNLAAVTVTPTSNSNFSAASVQAGMFVTGPPGSVGINATVVSKTTIATTNPAGSVTILALSVPHINTPQGEISISITPGNPVVAVSAGGFHTLALRQDGTVVAWGAGTTAPASPAVAPAYGQSVIPAGLTTLIGVASTIPRNDTGLVNTVTLSAANLGIVAGMLVTGPANTVGLGAKVLSVSGVTVTLSVANRNAPFTPTVPTLLNFYTGVTRISAGYYHSVALRNDGSVVAWGDNTAGQTTVPNGLTTLNFSTTGLPPNPAPGAANFITMGGNNPAIVPGMLVTGPPNTLGAGASILYKAGSPTVTMALSVPNAINANVASVSVPVLYTPGVKAVAIAAGNEHTMALRADGTIVMWGRNVEGETSTSGLTPITANATLPGSVMATVSLAAPVLPATTSSNYTVNLPAANAAIVPGMYVSDGGSGIIGAGAVVAAVSAVSPFPVTLSVPNTNAVALTGVNLTFFAQPNIVANANLAVGPTNTVTLTAVNAAIVAGMSVAGIPGTVGSGATILSKDVTGLILTISVPNTNTAVVTATPLVFYTPVPKPPNSTVILSAPNAAIVPGMYVTGPVSTVGVGAMVVSKATDNVTLTLSTRNAYLGAAASAATALVFSTGTTACAIAAGGDTSYVLKPDGTVTAWGDNFNGETNIPSGLTTPAAPITVSANLAAPVSPESTPSNFLVTLTTPNPAIVPGMLVTGPVGTVGFGVGSGATVLSTAPDHVTLTLSHVNVNTAALTGVSLNFYTGVMKVRAGGEHADALLTNGTVTAWGKIWNGSGYVPENLPPGLTGVTDISTGGYHTLAIGNTPLVITIQPVSLTVTPGATATFFVGAAGATTWQWQKNGLNIAGATSSTLVLTNVQASDLADYRVIVGNSAGSVISNVATLTGTGAFNPVIITQPASLSVPAGGTASFIVEAIGASSFQWYKDGTAIPGATGTSLSMTNVQTANAGSYKVVVSNNAGTSVTSNAAILIVNYTPPTITTQPVSVAALQGQTVTFSVTATGSAPLIYQWLKNGVPIPSATAATLTLSNVQASDADTYTVVITNTAGSVTSNPATLVLEFSPSITSSPLSYTAYEKLTANAMIPTNSGGSANTVTLVANNVGIVPGSLVSGPAGTVGVGAKVVKKVGLVLTLSVNNVVNLNPLAISAGLTFTPVHSFDVKGIGGALIYQWKRNGVVLGNGPSPTGSAAIVSGATTEVLTLTDMKPSDAGSYSVTVKNDLGAATSKVATLNVVPFNQIMYPAITSSLVELTLAKGVTMTPYQITANTNNPTTYSTKGLPSGVGCSSSTGLITGKPTKSGTYLVTLQAKSKTGGLASATMYFVVLP